LFVIGLPIIVLPNVGADGEVADEEDWKAGYRAGYWHGYDDGSSGRPPGTIGHPALGTPSTTGRSFPQFTTRGDGSIRTPTMFGGTSGDSGLGSSLWELGIDIELDTRSKGPGIYFEYDTMSSPPKLYVPQHGSGYRVWWGTSFGPGIDMRHAYFSGKITEYSEYSVIDPMQTAMVDHEHPWSLIGANTPIMDMDWIQSHAKGTAVDSYLAHTGARYCESVMGCLDTTVVLAPHLD
jgi:hypothetical protein